MKQIYFDNRTYSSEQINFQINDLYWNEFDEGNVNITINCKDFLNLTSTIHSSLIKNNSLPTLTLYVNDLLVYGNEISYISHNFTVSLISDRKFSESTSDHKLYYLINGVPSLLPAESIIPYLENLNHKLTFICTRNLLLQNKNYSFVLEFKDEFNILFQINFDVFCDKTPPIVDVPVCFISRKGILKIIVSDDKILNPDNIITVTINEQSRDYQIEQSGLYDLSSLIYNLGGTGGFYMKITVLDRAKNIRESSVGIIFDDEPPILISSIANGTSIKQMKFTINSNGMYVIAKLLKLAKAGTIQLQ